MADSGQKKNIFPFVLVFITGASCLAVELTASRILAPFFGNSIFIWGNIISVTLAALALGYWIGGKFSDLRPDPRLLYWIVLVSGLLTACIPLVFRFVISSVVLGLGGFQMIMIIGSFISILLLFFVPLFLLGTVSPFVIRLLAKDVATVGNTAGNVYAFSTLGSILGALSTTFGTIPFLGSRETLYFFSSLLCIIAVIGLLAKKKWVIGLAAIPLILWALSAGAPLKDRPGLLYSTESPYQYIEVVQEDDGMLTLRTNDGRGIQSMYSASSPFTSSYFDYFAVLPYYIDHQDVNVLNIGHAGGTTSRIYTTEIEKDKDISLDAVEIDPEITTVARNYFNLDEQPITIIHDDGRHYLESTDERYDIIIVDAYSQQIYIPFQLTTQEFFDLVRSRLTDQGLMAINVNAVNDDSRLLTSILSTIRSVFPYVYSAHYEDTFNYLIVASETPVNFDRPGIRPSSPYVAELMNRIQRDARGVDEGGEILTDNRAPVELLTDSMFFTLIRESRVDEVL
ncbi:MAG: fused MFS/spermidine synthase [Patescibacteria group bacterium]|jgi:spermidine synthase